MDEQIKNLQQQIGTMQAQLAELVEWKAARTVNQLFAPVDDTSKSVLGAFIDGGDLLFTATESVNVASVPTNITVAKKFDGVRLVVLGGANYAFPFYLPV